MPTIPKITLPDITLPDTTTTDAPGLTGVPPFDPTMAPYNAVCRITISFDGARYLGSGVMISPDEVLEHFEVARTRVF